ncbi:hypothetical protein Tco_0655899 [Tanacetum coccineum]|uniref:Secreted protein n=1 Tax=Tanacetum coccineum TaxID=301880 RepID=A0ABQ4X7X0_9ASTR
MQMCSLWFAKIALLTFQPLRSMQARPVLRLENFNFICGSLTGSRVQWKFQSLHALRARHYGWEHRVQVESFVMGKATCTFVKVGQVNAVHQFLANPGEAVYFANFSLNKE